MSNVGYSLGKLGARPEATCGATPRVHSSCKQLPFLHLARFRVRLPIISAAQATAHSGSIDDAQRKLAHSLSIVGWRRHAL